MKVAKPLSRLIDSFQRLPGIGPKSAQRLTYYLLHVPQSDLEEFAQALAQLKKSTKLCLICRNVSETNPCPVCSDDKRDKNTLLVVEQPLDILVFEKASAYHGLYHVLHGVINPLENIGPDELFIKDLIKRVGEKPQIKEVIIATNPTMEGDATAMYLSKQLRKSIKTNGESLIITRLGMGIPTGASLEFADQATLKEAIGGRKKI
jgi:recombination protein RecR